MTKKKEVIKNASFFYEEMKQQANTEINKALNSEDKKVRLSSNGKKYYLFPILKQSGFNTWDNIVEEYLLIAAKQSRLSATVRLAIETVVYHVNHRLSTYENLETVKKLTIEQQIKAKIPKKEK